MDIAKQAIRMVALMALVAIGLGILAAALYKVDESQYALELRFGQVRNVRLEPGLYFKVPFIDTVQPIDRRTLRADIPPREVPDRDKERLIIDVVVRFRITDPLQFRKSLRTETTARERLETITYSAMRDTIAQHDRTEVIGAHHRVDADGRPVSDDQGLPVYESLIDTRDRISQAIEDRIAFAVADQHYGIEVVSADIKRADFPSQVRSSIIDRIWAERERVAARHRADGEEEYRKRTAAVQKEADIIIAEAERDAREIRGEGDADAIRIVQEALLEDPPFYEFLRTLESYERSVADGATLVLTDRPGGYLNVLVGNSPALPAAGDAP